MYYNGKLTLWNSVGTCRGKEKIRKEKKKCLTHCTNECQCWKGTLAHSYWCQWSPFTKLSNMWDFDRFFRVGSILKRNMLVADMLFKIPRPSKKKWWFVNSEEYAVLIWAYLTHLLFGRWRFGVLYDLQRKMYAEKLPTSSGQRHK